MLTLAFESSLPSLQPTRRCSRILVTQEVHLYLGHRNLFNTILNKDYIYPGVLQSILRIFKIHPEVLQSILRTYTYTFKRNLNAFCHSVFTNLNIGDFQYSSSKH